MKLSFKNPYLWLGLLILAVQFVISYYGQWHYHYAVAPGDDVYVHLPEISYVSAHPSFWPLFNYPPGFYYLVIAVARLAGISFMAGMIWIWPALLLAAGLAIWWLSSQIFGKKIGLISYALFALLSLQPLQTAYDGTLPNILASGVFLPLTLTCWYKAWTTSLKERFLWLGGFLLGTALIIYTHHLSTFVWAGVTALSALVLSLVWLGHQRKSWGWWVGAAIIYTGLAALIYSAFQHSTFFSPERFLLSAVKGLTVQQKSYPLHSFVTAINPVIALFGFLGGVLAFWTLWKAKSWEEKAGLTIILAWFGIYFFGSRTSLVGEPERLGRDWAMPGTIMAAYCIARLLTAIKEERLKMGVAVLIVAAALVGFVVKTNRLVGYNPMVRFSAADSQLRERIQALPAASWPVDMVAHPLMKNAWAAVATNEVNQAKITFVSLDEATQFIEASPGRCVATGYSKGQIWPDDTHDNGTVRQLLKLPDVKVIYQVEDPNKVWYLVCRK